MVKLLKNVVLFLLLLFVIKHINSDQLISIVVQKCYGFCNKNYCNVSIACRPLNRTSKRVTIDFYIRPGLKLEAPIDIEVIAYKKFRTVYRQHMLKVKTELCAQLNGARHPYFSKIFKIQLGGNMRDPCPLSGHRHAEPYATSQSYFIGAIPLVPVGEWRLDFIISKIINNSNEFIASWSDFYEVKPTSSVEF